MAIKKSESTGIIILIIAIAAIFLLNQAHYLSFFSLTGGTGVPTNLGGLSGITLLGQSQLSNISIINNNYGHSGLWWISTAILGGPQTINVQRTASSFNPKNATLQANGQTDSLTLTLLKNTQEYLVSGAGQQISTYTVTYLTSNHNLNGQYVQIPYQSCVGVLPGSFVNSYNYSNQLVNFASCLSGGPQTYQNYANECRTLSGIPLPLTGTTANLQQSSQWWGCYQLVNVSYAYLYQLNPPYSNSTIALSLNGNTVTINTRSNPTNVTNPTMQLQSAGYTQLQAAPQSNASILEYIKNNTAIRVTGSAQNLLASYSSLQAQVKSYTPTSYANFNSSVGTYDAGLTGLFIRNNFGNIQYATGTTIPVMIVLNDTAGQYSRPVVQMVIKAAALGLSQVSPSFKITSLNITSIRSGGTGTATVTILGNGSVGGGVTATLSSPQGLVGTGASQQGSVTPGNTTRFTFQLTGQGNLYANYSSSLTAQVCGTYSGGTCQNITKSIVLYSACTGPTGSFNPSNCTTRSPAPVPSTTTICVSNCSATSTVGVILSTTCNSGYVYNVTSKTCQQTTTPQIPLIYIAIIAVVIIIAAVIFSKTKVRGGSGEMRRGPGRPPKSSYDTIGA